MAVYKIFPTQDTTLYSSYPLMNTGLDAICETSNILASNGDPGVSRFLTQFDSEEIKDIINNKISGDSYDIYLKNFIATAQGINQNTFLEILPLAQFWTNGTGHYLDSPQATDGASWYYPTFSSSGYWLESGSINGYNFTSSYDSNFIGYGGGNWFTDDSSSFYVTVGYVEEGYIYSLFPPSSSNNVSFALRDIKDIEANVSNIVNGWYNNSIPNYGFIVKLTSSQEFNPNPNFQPTLKYYSVDTNTIYPPHLEFRWRDYSTVLVTPPYVTSSYVTSGYVEPSLPPPAERIVSTSNIKLSLAENPGVFNPESINRNLKDIIKF